MSLIRSKSYTLPDLGVNAMYQEVAEYIKQVTSGDFIAGNVTLGQKASHFGLSEQDVSANNRTFLNGPVHRQKRVVRNHRLASSFWIKTLIVAAICFYPLYSLKS